jgi:hypothetical protein
VTGCVLPSKQRRRRDHRWRAAATGTTGAARAGRRRLRDHRSLKACRCRAFQPSWFRVQGVLPRPTVTAGRVPSTRLRIGQRLTQELPFRSASSPASSSSAPGMMVPCSSSSRASGGRARRGKLVTRRSGAAMQSRTARCRLLKTPRVYRHRDNKSPQEGDPALDLLPASCDRSDNASIASGSRPGRSDHNSNKIRSLPSCETDARGPCWRSAAPGRPRLSKAGLSIPWQLTSSHRYSVPIAARFRIGCAHIMYT